MAYYSKTRIESLAVDLSELRWSEMMDFARMLASCAPEFANDPTRWAATLNNWADEKKREIDEKSRAAS